MGDNNWRDENGNFSFRSISEPLKISQEFINKKNRFNGLEFIISIPEIYKKEGDVKIKKIEILLKN